MANPLRRLPEVGQSIWLDYNRRGFIESGDLQRLVTEDDLRGVTMNPSIFEKAIAGSADYDDALQALLAADPHADALTLYEALAVEDVQMVADVLRPVYDTTDGADGFVSLEVSPALAYDTAGTVAEARRLWRAVGRPNLMIKVPATPEGIPAIEALTAEGINVNITLMFSLAHYEAVAHAYLKGLGRCADPSRVASVASFFISRVDTAVDAALEAIGTPAALGLRGKVAIANARIVYARFREIFGADAFAPLRRRGARPQRPLWASTGTKNPAYSDVLYVEALIGRETVNTLPPATLNAFRDHGRVRPDAVEEGPAEAQAAVGRLKTLGIDLGALTERLQREGVAAFGASFDQLVASLEEKQSTMLAGQVARQRMSLGEHATRVDARLEAWQGAAFLRRLWAKDPTLWATASTPEIADRLGWLDLPEAMHERLGALRAFADEIKAEGIRHVVLIGMGGSSLAPEVFQRTFGNAAGFPGLIVLDSTHPDAVRAVEAEIGLGQTLFVVSSKSGTTTETLALFYYFWDRLRRAAQHPGNQFIAITDPDTPLIRLAQTRAFRRVFVAPPDVGGRYSALTDFGLVPAALIGVDVHRVLDRAWRMAEANAFCVACPRGPALALGSAIGELALAGRDKLTFMTSRSLGGLPAWIEQLIAESTGKDGKGIVPVVGEPAAEPAAYSADRVFVALFLADDGDPSLDRRVAAFEAAGHPVIMSRLTEKADLGQEFFKWELAVAAAGALLGIHPFNQPDVQLAKELAQAAMEGEGEVRRAGAGAAASVAADQPEALARALESLAAAVHPGDYVALQAYLAPSADTSAALDAIRLALRDRLRVATTSGYGPRFLHSTGQLHKGGPNTGVFLQFVDDPKADLSVPEAGYSFGALIKAQADGDLAALAQRGRRVVRVTLGREVAGGLRRVVDALRG